MRAAFAFLQPCSLVFAVGLLDDLTKRDPVPMRPMVTTLAVLVGCLVLSATVRTFGIPLIDLAFQVNLIAFFFTGVVVASVTNAVNLIDGSMGFPDLPA